jgi:hypothetical protein
MADELDRRDADTGSDEDGDVVMDRLVAKHGHRRQSA